MLSHELKLDCELVLNYRNGVSMPRFCLSFSSSVCRKDIKQAVTELGLPAYQLGHCFNCFNLVKSDCLDWYGLVGKIFSLFSLFVSFI